MIRAAAYIRVSTARQADEGLSLEAQEKRVREYIEREGWQLGELFIERGVSGRKADRPQLDRLMGSLSSIDRLVIPKLDRLGRSNKHLHDVFEALQAANVELVSLADNIDTSTSAGRLMRNILASLAEFESDVIGDRVRSVTAARVESGKHHGRVPYGYTSADGSLVPDEPAASVVRRIFEDFARGVSQRALCRALNNEGIRSQSGRDWTQGTVSKILANSTYGGQVTINGEVHEGSHEPIVSADLWERTASLREATRRTGGGRGRPSSGSHLFTRSLRLTCAHCGEAMIPRSSGKYEVYLCFGRQKHGPGFCDMGPVPRAEIDTAVFTYFENAALDIEASTAALRATIAAQTAEVAELLVQAQRDATRAAEAVARVRRDYTNGDLTVAEWRSLSAELNAEQEAADANFARLVARQAEIRAAEAAVEGAAIERLAEVRAAIAGTVANQRDLDAARAALARMFERFDIGRPGGGLERSEGERAVMRAQDKVIDRAMAAGGRTALDAGRWVIVPTARPEVVAGVDEAWRPLLHREAINIDAVGLQT
jgi:site-specific DNA recombinase